MFRPCLAPLALTLATQTAAAAVERVRLGYGNLITNDVVDGAEDRRRTGSYASSWGWGPAWTGAAPATFGQLIELRFHGEVITPQNLRSPAPGGRLSAGALSLGLHTHMRRGSVEYAVGADIVVIDRQTGLDGFQSDLHDLLDVAEPSDAVLAAQI